MVARCRVKIEKCSGVLRLKSILILNFFAAHLIQRDMLKDTLKAFDDFKNKQKSV